MEISWCWYYLRFLVTYTWVSTRQLYNKMYTAWHKIHNWPIIVTWPPTDAAKALWQENQKKRRQLNQLKVKVKWHFSHFSPWDSPAVVSWLVYGIAVLLFREQRTCITPDSGLHPIESVEIILLLFFGNIFSWRWCPENLFSFLPSSFKFQPRRSPVEYFFLAVVSWDHGPLSWELPTPISQNLTNRCIIKLHCIGQRVSLYVCHSGKALDEKTHSVQLLTYTCLCTRVFTISPPHICHRHTQHYRWTLDR